MPGPRPSPGERIRRAYRRHVDYRRQVSFRILAAFLATFTLVRALTLAIRDQLGPIHNLVVGGGLHIHHFVWGMLLVALTGLVALLVDQARWHPWLAYPFGIGLALILDEFALWLRLEDVYWAREGRESVDAVIVATVLLLLLWVLFDFWKALAREAGELLRRGT